MVGKLRGGGGVKPTEPFLLSKEKLDEKPRRSIGAGRLGGTLVVQSLETVVSLL